MTFYPLRRILRVVVAIVALIASGLLMPAAITHAATTYNVNSTTDSDTSTDESHCTLNQAGCTLRAAITDANNTAAGTSVTINVAAGTYNLTTSPVELDLFGNDNQNFTITGASAATTIINGDQHHIVFGVGFANNPKLTLSNLTVQHGKDEQATGGNLAGQGGGGLVAGGFGDQVTINNCVFQNNSADEGAGGAIQWVSFDTTGNQILTISNSTFTNNTINASGSGSFGGAIDFNGGTQMTITGSTFTNNTAGPGTLGQGGAVAAGSSNTTSGQPTFSITNSTFTNNTASTNSGTPVGSAIWNHGGTMTLQYDRIVNNTPSSTEVYQQSNVTPPGSITATDNWWGINTTPSVFVGGSPTPTVSPWITLKTTASPSTINYGASTTLTTSFLQDSNNNTLTTSNISVLLGLSVSWNASHGTLSSQQTTIQSSGKATATFTAGSTSADCGSVGKGEAQVDNVPNPDTTATATITIDCPDLQASKTNNVSNATQLANGAGCPPQCWTWTITGSNAGPGTGTYSNGQTILTDNLPNSNISYGSVTVTPNAGISGTISCSINVTDDLSCTASGTVTINGSDAGTSGSFTASFVATPTATGSYANPRSLGSCAIDPNNNIPETSDSNNSCSNTVTVNAPDLTVAKSNNVSGAIGIGNSWTWTLHVANSSTVATGTFLNTQTILTDDLPNSNISYGTAAPGNGSNITGIANISCSISSNTLTCSATGTVVIGTSGSFDVTFTATPTTVGTFTNPRNSGSCSVDPNNNVPETSDSNNACNSDSVTVTDSTPPTCSLVTSGTGASKQAQVTIQDSDGGLTSVQLTQMVNATSSPQPTPNAVNGFYTLPSPATSALVITFTKIKDLVSNITVVATDVGNNQKTCDPVLTSALRTAGKPQTDVISGITQSDHLVRISNDDPGVATLTLTVNGQDFKVAGLMGHQQVTIDIASALHAGANQVSVTTTGQPGGSATLVFGNI